MIRKQLGRFQIFVTWQKMLFSYFHIYARVGQEKTHAKEIFEIDRKFWPKIEIIVFRGNQQQLHLGLIDKNKLVTQGEILYIFRVHRLA